MRIRQSAPRTGFLRRYIGDRAFYGLVFSVVVPIIIQNGITNFVSLLDNIMVGSTGTEQMSGVSIANQVMFVFYITIYGGLAGSGIFGAQFYGAGNEEGLRQCFRFKWIVGLATTFVALAIFLLFSPQLISLFLQGDSADGDPAATLRYGADYMRVMLWGMLPFTISQIYAGTLRETGHTRLPMIAGIVAVFVNMGFNYLLIFGKLGFPKLGVVGAAIATVISRYIEMGIIVVFTHRHSEIYHFILGAYRHFAIPSELARRIVVKTMPLLMNELFWSLGVTVLSQTYSLRGLGVVAAMNISSTVSNLFNVVYLSMGNAAAILVGQSLGAGRMEEAKDRARKLLTFSVACCVVMGGLLALASPLIPKIYNTTDAVRGLSTQFMQVFCVIMPAYGFVHCCYFVLRSGGKTVLTFLFDSAFSWVVIIPLAWCLTHLTDMPILSIYAICQATELLKAFIGYAMLKSGIWIHNIVN